MDKYFSHLACTDCSAVLPPPETTIGLVNIMLHDAHSAFATLEEHFLQARLHSGGLSSENTIGAVTMGAQAFGVRVIVIIRDNGQVMVSAMATGTQVGVVSAKLL